MISLAGEKRFFAVVGIGIAVLLVLWAVATNIRQSAVARRRRSDAIETEIAENRAEFLDSEAAVMEKNRILKEEILPEVERRIEFTHSIPEARDVEPGVQLRQLLDAAQRDARNIAARLNLEIPEDDWDISRRIKKSNATHDIEELKLRLAMTEAIVSAALAGGVEKIESIKQQEQEFASLVEGRGGSFYLMRTPVVLNLQVGLRPLLTMLHAFQNEEQFLSVTSAHLETAQSAVTALIHIEIEFAALKLLTEEEAKELGKAPEKRPVSGSERPRRRYRRRY